MNTYKIYRIGNPDADIAVGVSDPADWVRSHALTHNPHATDAQILEIERREYYYREEL